MIDRDHDLPVQRQAELMGISRGSVYYLPRPVSDADLRLMRHIDELHLELPFAGSRMLREMLRAEGVEVGRKHVATLSSCVNPNSFIRFVHVDRAPPSRRLGRALPSLTSLPMTRFPPCPCCVCV